MRTPTYKSDHLSRIAFPLGGIGAGMICLEGSGTLSHVSLRNKPDIFHEPLIFAALHVKGGGGAPTARVIEGPVPQWKAFGTFASGTGASGKNYGLPRFAKAAFTPRFPFAQIDLADKTMPVEVELTGWSPFIPNNADDSSLPVAALEYRLINRSSKAVEAVLSYHAFNFMKTAEHKDFHDKKDNKGSAILPMEGGFVLSQPAVEGKPAEEGYFAAFVLPSSTGNRTLDTGHSVKVDCAWFRGGWYDPATMVWNTISAGKAVAKPPHDDATKPGNGGSFYVPVKLKPKSEQTIRVLLAWYVPRSEIKAGADPAPPQSPPPATTAATPCCDSGCCKAVPEHHIPWYAGRFRSIADVADYWRSNYARLRSASAAFADCFYDTTLPAEAVESVAANLTILKSPTCLRQADGRFWCWEGCADKDGCCHGSCTHVWNYAQALPHLFPALERSLRETEFGPSQAPTGHQSFRANLPIRPTDHKFHAAADGQLGGIMKVHREWRILGDTAWLASLWPAIRQSLDYCIETWDPSRAGLLVEPHHNTYDIEFWGADGMCTSFYLGALAAAIAMGKALSEDVSAYESLLAKGRKAIDTKLWNGAYYYQKVQWKGLKAADPSTTQAWNTSYSPEAIAILNKEGPKYQYGTGCLSDGVLGDWIARCCGVTPPLTPAKTAGHLASIFKHNFRTDLSDHANPQRPSYAFGSEAGLLLCSWPKGGKPNLPFVYSDEVWTGIEYQVASHLIMMGKVKEGLAIVHAVRGRYDGRYRNPFNEYECGHWYARAMSSYGLLQALSGARYDAVTKTLHLAPPIKGDFRAFISTATGYGTVGVKKGKPFVEVKSGTIAVNHIDFQKN